MLYLFHPAGAKIVPPLIKKYPRLYSTAYGSLTQVILQIIDEEFSCIEILSGKNIVSLS